MEIFVCCWVWGIGGRVMGDFWRYLFVFCSGWNGVAFGLVGVLLCRYRVKKVGGKVGTVDL